LIPFINPAAWQRRFIVGRARPLYAVLAPRASPCFLMIATMASGATANATIVVALTIAPLPAVAFEEDEFCTTVADIARRRNARAGRWLDRSTCHDGVEVDCGLKTLEAQRSRGHR
jgi:hypothetical protein